MHTQDKSNRLVVIGLSLFLILGVAYILFSPHTEKGQEKGQYYAEVSSASPLDQDPEVIKAVYWYLDQQIPPVKEGWKHGAVIQSHRRSKDTECVVVFNDYSVGPILIYDTPSRLIPKFSYIWFKLDKGNNYVVRNIRVIEKNIKLKL